jgi:heat shock protein HslJ
MRIQCNSRRREWKMRSLIRLMLITFSGVLLLTACGTKAIEVDETVWQLMFINGESPIVESSITLRFQDGRMEGSSGCNTYGGDYTLGDDGAFQAGPIEVTEMACLDPQGVMDQEDNYLRILQMANKLVREEDELTIEGGGDTLEFWGIFE